MSPNLLKKERWHHLKNTT